MSQFTSHNCLDIPSKHPRLAEYEKDYVDKYIYTVGHRVRYVFLETFTQLLLQIVFLLYSRTDVTQKLNISDIIRNREIFLI